jgi:hypothetical protein
MSSEVMHQILQTIEQGVNSRPSAIEFEMAYQARVAIDRIRFAIKHTERFAQHTDPISEVGLQLLDALERLETADRRFQQRSRGGARSEPTDTRKSSAGEHVNGKGAPNVAGNGA